MEYEAKYNDGCFLFFLFLFLEMTAGEGAVIGDKVVAVYQEELIHFLFRFCGRKAVSCREPPPPRNSVCKMGALRSSG